jgi:hypothetical protein
MAAIIGAIFGTQVLKYSAGTTFHHVELNWKLSVATMANKISSCSCMNVLKIESRWHANGKVNFSR